jgi:hypothetical protein
MLKSANLRMVPLLGGTANILSKVPELAVVVTVTVAVEEAPLSVIEPGDTEQAECAGAPMQENVTFWLNPPAEATVKL